MVFLTLQAQHCDSLLQTSHLKLDGCNFSMRLKQYLSVQHDEVSNPVKYLFNKFSTGCLHNTTKANSLSPLGQDHCSNA